MATTLQGTLLAGLLATLHVAGLGAQSSPDLVRARGEPRIVTAIDLRRQSVFDSTEATSWITRLANKLHVQTRRSVVQHELLFRSGAPFDSGLVAESARNLRALGIFREVTIDTVTAGPGVIARVTTKDGWTTALDFTLQTTGSQVAWSTEYHETNLLGTNSSVLVKYARDIDRTSSQFQFSRPRRIANTIGAQLAYEHRSDGHQVMVGLSRPFTSLAAPNGADIVFQDFDGRLLRFTGGLVLPSDSVQRRTTLVRLHAATAQHASTRGYLRFGITAQLLRDDMVPEGAGITMPRTITAAIGPSVEWSRARYVVSRSYEHFGQPEDVDLSSRIYAEVLAAPRGLGYAHDGIGPAVAVRLGAPIPGGFGVLEGSVHGIVSAAGLDSGTARVAGTAVVAPGSDRQRLLLHAEAGWSKGAPIGSEFDLGFGIGPRAFRSHSFTGDRSWYATAEYRYMLASNVGKLAGLGLAGFADRGGAWFAGSPERAGSDVGLGIRIGPTRQADLRTARIDLAYRFATDVEPGGWVVVVGKGFTFRSVQ